MQLHICRYAMANVTLRHKWHNSNAHWRALLWYNRMVHAGHGFSRLLQEHTCLAPGCARHVCW